VDRETAKSKIERVLKRLDAGGLPIPIKSLWVFGSYARGALQVRDVDLLIEEEWYESPKPPWEPGQCPLRVALRRELRKNGERIQLIATSSASLFLAELNDHAGTLLWAKDDHDWRPKLDAITPDPAAARVPRAGEIFSEHPGWRRDRETMERVDGAIARGELRLRRVPVDEMVELLHFTDVPHAGWTAHTTRVKEQDHRLILAGCGWMRSLGVPSSKIIWDDWHGWSPDRRNHIYVGHPPLWCALWPIERRTVDRFCGIPYARKRRPNYGWIFERP
jgi:hypothetical protein